MFVIKNKKIFISISAGLVGAAILFLVFFGLPLGIDFRGGSLVEVSYENNRPEVTVAESVLESAGFSNTLIQPSGEREFILKTRELTNDEKNKLISALSISESKAVEKSFTSVGPSVGKELRRKAIISIVLVSLAITLFIAYAFRKVSKPVSSWKYGIIAIVTLLHDVMIPVGLFSVLSYFYGAEVDTLFVVACLTILGLSVSDTIVVFDRIRENLRTLPPNTPFSEIVGKSIDQTFARSINTSLTVILTLLALVFFGPESTRIFALMLTAGMFVGAYSSIFLASPLLVLWQESKIKKP